MNETLRQLTIERELISQLLLEANTPPFEEPAQTLPIDERTVLGSPNSTGH